MFSLFVNDIESYLPQNSTQGYEIDNLTLFLLLFADDSVLLSETADDLQNLINNFEKYCKKWKLTVNVNKTKIVVFKKGRLNRNIKFTYGNDNLEIVDAFNYLGVVFTRTGSFLNATKTLSGKGLKALGALMAMTRGKVVPINIMLDLFDSFVTSTLSYGCEIWSFTNTDNLEKVHKQFLKWLLNVKLTTCNSALYGEIGRYPLKINMQVKTIKYYLKLYSVKGSNCIMSTVVENMKYRFETRSEINWLSEIRNLLQQSGFNDVWLFPRSVNIKQFTPILRSRLIDLYINEWHRDIANRSSLVLYRNIKSSFTRSNYLDIMKILKISKRIGKIQTVVT